MANSITFTLGYNGTDFTRKYKLSNVTNANAEPNTVRAKVQAINASLAGGTSDGLDNFFLADDYDANEGIGTLKEIVAVQVDTSTREVIDLGE